MPGIAEPEQGPAILARLRAAGCVFAEDEARLLISAAQTPAALEELVRRRVEGQPLEVILGWAEFCQLRIVVRAGVFVPRRRTEFLVEQAAGIARPGAVILDLCCGTGALGVALLARLGRAELHAADIDPAAVDCARGNVEPVGGRVYQGDLYQPLPATLRGRVDVLLVNAPYVPTDQIEFMPAEARSYESLVALDGGQDGTAVQRRVIEGASNWLAPGGSLLIETSRRQGPLTVERLSRAGFRSRLARSDELAATVAIGTLAAGRQR